MINKMLDSEKYDKPVTKDHRAAQNQPKTKIFRRPNKSPSRPDTKINEPSVNAYEPMYQTFCEFRPDPFSSKYS